VGAKKNNGASFGSPPLFLAEEKMNLSFYRVGADYCDFLRKTDPCVPYTMDKKELRPFVGIILDIEGMSYYAPLTSPKPKYIKMKTQMDFIKINAGVWGAINLNNMIPIHKSSLISVDFKIVPTDSKSEMDYKNLLSNQLSWCNANKEQILRQALKLYTIISNGRAWPELMSRCCNFKLDEQQYIVYCQANNLEFYAKV
jgi:protein AbiQ